MVWRTKESSTQPTAKTPTLNKNEVLEAMLGEGGASLGVAELVLDKLLIEGRYCRKIQAKPARPADHFERASKS